MKYITLISLAVFLSACTPKTEDITDSGKYYVPKALQDCNIYEMHSNTGNRVVIVRCPNSTVSATKLGKHPTRSVTLED